MQTKGEVMPSVLSIEPNELNQKLFRDLISYKGNYDLKCVTSPLEAMNMLGQSQRFDLIVSEMRLPDISGLNFANWLSRSEWSGVPLVAWTACAFADEKKTMLEAGFQAILTKPSSLQSILDFVRSHAYPELRFVA